MLCVSYDRVYCRFDLDLTFHFDNDNKFNNDNNNVSLCVNIIIIPQSINSTSTLHRGLIY